MEAAMRRIIHASRLFACPNAGNPRSLAFVSPLGIRVVCQLFLAGWMFASIAQTSFAQDVDESADRGPTATRPNIVFCMADDWSWPHAGAMGDSVVKTPHFDRIAAEGVLFENAFVSTPSCTPSRLSILAGQHHWRLKEGDSLGGSLREEFAVYTELLQASGYRIGRYGKGVWPSKHTFRKRDSFGPKFRSFDDFLKDRASGEPFCYWHGGQDPHRPYELGIGVKSGMPLSRIDVPSCLPDHETVRRDLADYLWEVQRFDREVGEIIEALESIGELERTLFVISGDNGMPFPRCKATLYDLGTRVPLAVRMGTELPGSEKGKPGRRFKDFVTLCDLAPTFLEAADLAVPEQMTGQSLLGILRSDRSVDSEASRTFVLTGVERHVHDYPKRAIRTKDFLYIRNFEPGKWKTGEIQGQDRQYDFSQTPWPTGPGAFSFAIDPSPTKQFLRLHRDDAAVASFAKLAFPTWPKEELYDLGRDPGQLNNVAGDPEYAAALQRLGKRLTAELIKTNDRRVGVAGYTSRSIEGWPVRVSDELLQENRVQTDRALELIAEQLRRVKEVLPPEPLARVRTVPIWLSPPYQGVRPTGEYHPGAAWLADQGRRPELHQCVELTNTAILEREVKRMPMLLLHELAHAYHDQVLGFEQAAIRKAFRSARESGIYNEVERSNGSIEKAYAMTTPMEYFAETTEAFFGVNDFYPFTRTELERHDRRMYDLLAELWDAETP